MSGGGGGGDGVNFELNLVPFIDLFSTLICFLLMTAAWQELDAMNNSVPPKAATEAPDTPQPTPPPDQPKKVNLAVILGVDKIDITEDDKSTPIPNVNGEPDMTQLKLVLQNWKTRFPDRKDVILGTDSKQKYKYLVLMMDTLIAEKFPDVSINLN